MPRIAIFGFFPQKGFLLQLKFPPPTTFKRQNIQVCSCPNCAYFRFTDLAEMVCQVRQVTPDREWLLHDDINNDDDDQLDTEPDESEIVSDPEEYLEEGESGFISHHTGH